MCVLVWTAFSFKEFNFFPKQVRRRNEAKMIRFHLQRTGVMESAFTLILICRHAFSQSQQVPRRGPDMTADKICSFLWPSPSQNFFLKPLGLGSSIRAASLAREAPDALRGPQAWVGQGPHLWGAGQRRSPGHVSYSRRT